MKKVYLAGCALSALASPSFAQAQTAPVSSSAARPTPATEDIIVTAQRREESLQKTALSIAAVSNRELIRNNLNSVAELERVLPSLQALNSNGPYATYAVRGVSSVTSNAFGDSAVQINVNGVPLARVTSGRNQMFDLERVEFLKGPQGTLYGRNATGGAINLIAARPNLADDSFTGRLTVGNYSRIGTQGAANLVVSDTLAARFAFQTEDRDGFFSDDTEDQHRQSVRGSVLWKPSDTMSLLVIGDYSRMNERGAGGTYVSRTAPYDFLADPFTSAVDLSPAVTAAAAASRPNGCTAGAALAITGPRPCVPLPRNAYSRGTFFGISGELNWEILGGTLTALVGHRRDDYSFLSTASVFIQNENFNITDQDSAEIRYATDASRRLSAVIGVFAMTSSQRGDFQYDQQSFGTTSRQIINPAKSNTKAAFADGTFKVTDTFRISAGIRYSYEKKSLNARLANELFFRPYIDAPTAEVPGSSFIARGSRSWSATNWRAVAAWDWRRDSLLFINVGTGFKSGGFYLSPDLPNTYNPENVTSYTIGSKNRLFDGNLTINAEIFQLDFKNQQLAVLDTPASNPNLLIFPQQNAGSSRIRGAELESSLNVFTNTRLNANIQYLDSKFKDFSPTTVNLSAQNCPFTNLPSTPGSVFTRIQLDCSGRPLIRAPKWSIFLSGTQTFPLASGARVELNANFRYTDEQWASASFNPASLIPSSSRTNGSLTYFSSDDRWSAQLWVENLTDRADVIQRGSSAGGLNLYYANLLPPRTYGVTLTGKF